MNDLLANPSLVALLAIVAPFVISLVKRPGWPDEVKQAIAIVVSVGFGVLAVALRVEGGGTEWSVNVVVGHAGVVFATAQGVYWFLLRGEGTPAAALNARLEAVGAKKPGVSE